MKVQGVLESLAVDGYERKLTIRSSGRTLCFNCLQADEYLEPGQSSRHLAAGDPVVITVVLCLASATRLDPEEEVGIVQGIAESPHAVVVGRVMRIAGPDACVLDVGDGGELPVEFEE